MSLFETPDGKAVNDGDYVLVLKDVPDGQRVVDARQFNKKSDDHVEFEPVKEEEEFNQGYFADSDWMTETYAEKYPPSRYTYEVKSSTLAKIKAKFQL